MYKTKILILSIFFAIGIYADSLSQWNNSDKKILKDTIQQIKSYFSRQKSNIPAFCNQVSSLSFKANIIYDNKHSITVWNKHFFSHSELSNKLNQQIQSFVYSIEHNKNKHLLQLPYGYTKGCLKITPFQEILKAEIQATAQDAGIDMVVAEIIALAAGEVVAQIVIDVTNYIIAEVAVEGSAATLGGATSFGIGLVVVIGIDYLFSSLAKERLAEKLDKQFDEMSDEVIKQVKPKLEKALKKYHQEKKRLSR